jgi:uncharacterized protein (UPF0335 family)
MTQIAANSDEGRAAPFLSRIENILDELASKKGEYMAECKTLHEDVKDIYAEAKAAGVRVKALRRLVKYRELERRQAALADELEGDDAEAFEHLRDALGELADLPLGKAALGEEQIDLEEEIEKRAVPKGKRGGGKKAQPTAAAGDGDDADVRPRFMQNAEAEALKQVEEKGIAKAAADTIGEMPPTYKTVN